MKELLERCREMIAANYIQPMPEGRMECLDCRSNLSRWEHDDKCPTGKLLSDLDIAIAKEGKVIEVTIEKIKAGEWLCYWRIDFDGICLGDMPLNVPEPYETREEAEQDAASLDGATIKWNKE
jgi:hypothetical protein